MADPLGPTASVIAIVTLAYTSSKALVNTIQGIRNGPEDLLGLKANLLSFQNVWSHSNEQHTSLRERVKFDFNSKSTNGFASQLDGYQTVITVVLNATLLKTTTQATDAVLDLEKTITAFIESQEKTQLKNVQECRTIATWLSARNDVRTQQNVCRNLVSDVGQWLFQEDTFKRWLETPGEILWCKGIPGAGKTALASMIIDIEKQYSDKKGGGIAYAFCNYDEQSLQTPQEIFESLLSQAVRHQEFINEALEQAHRDNSKRGHQLPLNTKAGDIRAYLEVPNFSGTENGVDVNAGGGELGTALQAACANKWLPLEIPLLLLEKGADAKAQGRRYGNALTALKARGALEPTNFDGPKKEENFET
ncbi:hypothetical protein B0J14DRAFT_559676 [Halenospora varia]|nr:hypothetical protein B0J14DRAFT_559676 [Halenospora varia]